MSTIYRSILILLTLISVPACSDVESLGDEESTEKAYSSESYYEDVYNEDYVNSTDDEKLIQLFLEQDIGDLTDGDLTDGSSLVAGPGAGPSVLLSCTDGVLQVTAGVATGVLATVFATSGVLAGGAGVVATAPASLPIYATAGGLIGLGLSSSSWATCLAPLAKVGLGLIQNGYLSAARGLQSIVFQVRRDSASGVQSQSTTSECKSGGRKCNQMTGRYKNNFCNPLNEWRDSLNINVHEHGICDLGGLDCNQVTEVARLAAGCWRGREAVTQRCFNGKADPGHKKATEYAEDDFFSCIDLSFNMGCGDYSIEDRLDDQAQNAYPECL